MCQIIIRARAGRDHTYFCNLSDEGQNFLTRREGSRWGSGVEIILVNQMKMYSHPLLSPHPTASRENKSLRDLSLTSMKSGTKISSYYSIHGTSRVG